MRIITLSLLFIFVSANLIADDYEYDYDYHEDTANESIFEFGAIAGLSFTQTKTDFWDDGFTLGASLRYNVNDDVLTGLNATYTIWTPIQEFVSERYEYEIYPLTFDFLYRLFPFKDYSVYGGLGLSYIYGEYQIDNIEDLGGGRTRLLLRRQWASHGWGFNPQILIRVPFGGNFKSDLNVFYRYIYMEDRNGAELSIDHLNVNLTFHYIFK